MKSVLTIAGSDSSGGAGIQADIKAMLANDVYAMSAITALTAQNTTGVTAATAIDAAFLKKQLDAIFLDIVPQAVKTGMIASPEQVKVIADTMKFYKVENLVVDPVMIATSGAELANKDVIKAMMTYLFPIAKLITPNLFEAVTLLKLSGNESILHNTVNDSDVEEMAVKISKFFNCNVLIKGGHRKDSSDDLLYKKNGQFIWFRGSRIKNNNTHGTGCTLSSTIASYLAKGNSLEKSIELAKGYITAILKSDLDLGNGSGPLDHGYLLRRL